MEKSFEDLFTGLDDEFELDIDDIFINYDYFFEVCYFDIFRGQLLVGRIFYFGIDLLDFNFCSVNFIGYFFIFLIIQFREGGCLRLYNFIFEEFCLLEIIQQIC